MEWASLIVALLGAGIAVFIPIFVEYSRRPVLEIKRWDDLNLDRPEPLPTQRLVHVRVINRPLSGWRAKYLLRNVATGCTLHVTFTSESDRTKLYVPARWSGHAEPRKRDMVVPGQPGQNWGTISVTSPANFTLVLQTVDPADVVQGRVIDVSPGDAGQVAGIAIKSDGEAPAYAFSSESYGYDLLENPEWRLEHERYMVEVVAEAGGVRSKPTRFVLENEGTEYRGLRLKESA